MKIVTYICRSVGIIDPEREKQKVEEEKATEEFLMKESEQEILKPCPFCGCSNIKPSGCMYVTCEFVDNPSRWERMDMGVIQHFQKLLELNMNGIFTGKTMDDLKEEIDAMQRENRKQAFICPGGFNKKGEWCWIDNLPKYQPDPNNPAKGCCNNKSHNSH